jgi:hypothetical protein
MNTGKQTYKFTFSLKGHVYYMYVCVSPKTYWKFRGYVLDNCFKLILCCMNKRYFPLKEKYSYFQSNYSIYSNKFPLLFHQVWEKHCSAYRLHIARATFLRLKLSIKATFIITSARLQLVANCQVRFTFFPHFDIGHSLYDTREPGSGILPQIIGLKKNGF